MLNCVFLYVTVLKEKVQSELKSWLNHVLMLMLMLRAVQFRGLNE